MLSLAAVHGTILDIQINALSGRWALPRRCTLREMKSQGNALSRGYAHKEMPLKEMHAEYMSSLLRYVNSYRKFTLKGTHKEMCSPENAPSWGYVLK